MKVNRIAISLFLLVHHVIAILHGGAHTDLAIFLPPYKDFFVIAVMIILPIIAIILVWTRLVRWGLLLLACSMAAALLFDVYHHYILVSPDNIAHLPHGTDEQHMHFTWTANAIAALQFIGTLWAGYLFVKSDR